MLGVTPYAGSNPALSAIFGLGKTITLQFHLYGIGNCSTVQKALDWFESEGLQAHLHDYKEIGVDREVLQAAIAAHGWEKVLNRASYTWRGLNEDIKSQMDETLAVETAIHSPSLIKRPMIVYNQNGEQHILLGWRDKQKQAVLSAGA